MFLKSTGMQIINTFKFYFACLNRLDWLKSLSKCKHFTNVKPRVVSSANEKLFICYSSLLDLLIIIIYFKFLYGDTAKSSKNLCFSRTTELERLNEHLETQIISIVKSWYNKVFCWQNRLQIHLIRIYYIFHWDPICVF